MRCGRLLRDDTGTRRDRHGDVREAVLLHRGLRRKARHTPQVPEVVGSERRRSGSDTSSRAQAGLLAHRRASGGHTGRPEGGTSDSRRSFPFREAAPYRRPPGIVEGRDPKCIVPLRLTVAGTAPDWSLASCVTGECRLSSGPPIRHSQHGTRNSQLGTDTTGVPFSSRSARADAGTRGVCEGT
jgi:hypothetical protein